MYGVLRSFIGTKEEDLPRIRATVRQRGFMVSTALFVAAAAILAASSFFPYWRMRLNAPQYPQGLYLTVYIDHLQGDINEIDGLNHYIGMAPLRDAARIERELAPTALLVIVLLITATAFIHRRWFAPMTIPAMLLPLIFLGNMYFWLRRYGQGLDPRAALSSSVEPFTPTLLGRGVIGQFSTDAMLQIGFWLAVVGSCFIVAGLYLRHAAWRTAEAEIMAADGRHSGAATLVTEDHP